MLNLVTIPKSKVGEYEAASRKIDKKLVTDSHSLWVDKYEPFSPKELVVHTSKVSSHVARNSHYATHILIIG